MSAKQRPHASPAPSPGLEPNASWLIAAVNPDAALPHAARRQAGAEPATKSGEGGRAPGWLQPEYIVKDAWPDGFWTYPPVARFSVTVSALAMPAAATKERRAESFAMVEQNKAHFCRPAALYAYNRRDVDAGREENSRLISSRQGSGRYIIVIPSETAMVRMCDEGKAESVH